MSGRTTSVISHHGCIILMTDLDVASVMTWMTEPLAMTAFTFADPATGEDIESSLMWSIMWPIL